MDLTDDHKELIIKVLDEILHRVKSQSESENFYSLANFMNKSEF